jgi:hypothetical protein
MYNCQRELVKPVVIRPSPVNKPIRDNVTFGPYLSRAQPMKKAETPDNSRLTEKMEEVAARESPNSISNDLKKTPYENRTP